MGASKVAICIRSADIVNPGDHKNCDATLNNGTKQRRKALRDKQ
jgi:hypothetical protein